MNAVAEKKPTQTLTIADSINKMAPEFERALPKHIPSERFTRIAVSAVNSNPDLLGADIDRRSLFSAVMKAAQDGLVIDNREAALVTFRTKSGGKVAQYMPMVAGLLKKMRNSGEIANISYGLVYQKELETGAFKYIKGDHESLEHTPILFGEKGNLIGVYSVVTTKDGSKIREFMDMKQIAKVRNSSRSKDSGPWVSWFEEMCVKSVLRKVSKLCPSSSDLDDAFKNDDETSGIENPEYNDEPTPANPTHAEVKKENSTLSKVKGKASAAVDAEYVEVEHEAKSAAGSQEDDFIPEEEIPI